MAFVYAIYWNEWNIEFYVQLRGGTYVLFYRHTYSVSWTCTTFVREFTFSILTSTLQLQCLMYNLNVLCNVNVQFCIKYRYKVHIWNQGSFCV